MFKNVIGLIVEYNPFHNGHLHHIQEIDKDLKVLSAPELF